MFYFTVRLKHGMTDVDVSSWGPIWSYYRVCKACNRTEIGRKYFYSFTHRKYLLYFSLFRGFVSWKWFQRKDKTRCNFSIKTFFDKLVEEIRGSCLQILLIEIIFQEWSRKHQGTIICPYAIMQHSKSAKL